MEINQPLDNDLQEGLSLTRSAQSFLQETAKWAKFLAVLGFIICGFMVAGALGMLTMSDMMFAGAGDLPFSPTLFVLLYLAFAAIYFLPVLYLYRFSSFAQEALRDNSESRLEAAMENMKSHYKFMGVMAIVVIAGYLLFFIGLLVTVSTGVFSDFQ